jgi:4'-phosphopantetheinyl transferase
MKIFWPVAVQTVAMSADEAHLYAVPLDAMRNRWDELQTILTPDERQRAEQFQLDAPRRRFVIARAALRILLGRYLDLRPADVALSVGANGKPRLDDEHDKHDLHFNLAHSGDLALVVLANGCEVGVDLERLRAVRHAEHIAKRYFHPAEMEAILSAPPSARDTAFLKCWTGKEAVLKAIGIGITGSLTAFQVPIHEDDGAYVEIFASLHGKPTQCWLQRVDPCSEYLAAVAFENSRRKVRCFTLEP